MVLISEHLLDMSNRPGDMLHGHGEEDIENLRAPTGVALEIAKVGSWHGSYMGKTWS